MNCFRDAVAAIGAGTWPDWLSAAATTVAVLTAAVTYRNSRRDDHVAQARKVYVLHTTDRYQEGDWVDTGYGWAERGALLLRPDEARGYQLKTKGVHVRATVHNASDEVISSVEVAVLAENTDDWPEPRDARYVVGAISPGASYVVHFVVTDLWQSDFSVQGLDLSIRLRFTDSAGNHWSREDARPVQELKHHDVGWSLGPGLISTARTTD